MQKVAYYITTAIDYVNARPHIGHALEKIQADVLARYYRSRLGSDTVWFLTGTDDNALKNVLAAKEAGLDTKEFVDRNAESFKMLKEVLALSWNDFIRTTELRHVDGVKKFWLACKTEDIYKKSYKGLYCVGCEEFKTERDLINNECPEHPGKKLEVVEEENYFFKLSKYQKQLEELIDKDTLQIIPATRKNEMLSFIKQGLEDFSISRSRSRAHDWGIPVPGDDSQIIYVWFDALINYITAVGYGLDEVRFTKWWREAETLHVIGKGINRFHTVYWPAMLLSADVPLPKKVFVHGYVTSEGQKISKTLGNVIDPMEIVRKYGTDPVRYYLLREISAYEDGDFSEKKFIERYNGELANGLGNLVARVTALGENLSPLALGSHNLPDLLKKARVEYDGAMETFRFNEALGIVWKRVTDADVMLNQKEPWKIKDETAKRGVIAELCLEIAVITSLVEPFLPGTADKVKKQISFDRQEKAWHIKKGEALFPRLTA